MLYYTMEEESMSELLHQYATKLNSRVDTLETQLESLAIKTLYGQKPELETKKPELETKKPKNFSVCSEETLRLRKILSLKKNLWKNYYINIL